MRRGRWAKVARWWTLALYALASLSVSFAHEAPPRYSEGLAQFSMPDGTLPIICSTKGETGRTGAHKPGGCKACRLITAPGLPPSRSEGTELHIPQVLIGRAATRQITFIGPNPALSPLGARGPPTA